MSEEIKKTGAEINEAALEGVSGGDIDQKALNDAKLLCAKCKEHSRKRGMKACNGGSADLVAELPTKVTIFTHCPYYGEPVG